MQIHESVNPPKKTLPVVVKLNKNRKVNGTVGEVKRVKVTTAAVSVHYIIYGGTIFRWENVGGKHTNTVLTVRIRQCKLTVYKWQQEPVLKFK